MWVFFAATPHCTPPTLSASRWDMSLAVGAEGESAFAKIPKLNSSNICLVEWEETMVSAVCLYQVPGRLVVELAINALEDDARDSNGDALLENKLLWNRLCHT